MTEPEVATVNAPALSVTSIQNLLGKVSATEQTRLIPNERLCMLKSSWLVSFALLFTFSLSLSAAESTPLPIVRDIELQPLGAQVKRLIETLDSLGAPLAQKDVNALERAIQSADSDAAVATIQQTLDQVLSGRSEHQS